MDASALRAARSRVGRGPAPAIARRAFLDARVRTIAFAYLFAIYGYIQPVGYRHAYPTLHSRLDFAHSFANNKAVVVFYGKAYDLLTVGGYTAWRVGGTLAIVAAVLGVLAAVRAMRTEEDSGRAELVLAGIIHRRSWFAAALASIAAGMLVLWLAETVGLIVGGLSAGGSAYLALSDISVLAVFAGVGAVVSQLAPTRRLALELGSAAVGVFWLLRVAADTSGGVDWLRWATPIGWAEEMRPFTGAQPLVLLLPLAATAILVAIAARIAAARDIGTGLLQSRDEAEPRLYLLGSPTAQALRRELGSLTVWMASVGAFGLVMGLVSHSVSSAGISEQLSHTLGKLGSGSVLTPSGYLGFAFVFFVLAAGVFACSQIAAARHEEAEEQLETLFALPVSRRGWLTGRLLLATGAIVTLGAAAALSSWLGAVSQGESLSLARMLEAGVNCLPVGLLFLGLGALAYAILPRASAGIAYGLVAVAFLWYLTGALLGAPKWLVDVSPFQHVGLVPAQAFRPVSALVMTGIGVVAAAVAVVAFERRDLIGA
jgi:polyether ionophore transport system permease protein